MKRTSLPLMTTFPEFASTSEPLNSSASVSIRFMYESTLFIRPLYSISLLSLTATLRLIARCNVDSGRFGCCCDDGEDNIANHFSKNRGSNKKVPLPQVDKQVLYT